jgi:hypothetical protein
MIRSAPNVASLEVSAVGLSLSTKQPGEDSAATVVLRYRLLPEPRRVGNDLSAVNVGGQTPVNLMWRIAGFHWFGLWGKSSSPDEVFRRLMPGDSIHWIRHLFQSCQPGRASTNPSGSGLRRHVMTRPR